MSKTTIKKPPKSVKSAQSAFKVRRTSVDKTKGLKPSLADYQQMLTEKSLAYKILSQTDVALIVTLSPQDLEQKIMEFLNVEDLVFNLQKACIVDCYVSALLWAREQDFSLEQTSGFFTVIYTLLKNIEEQKMTMLENSSEFREMLVGIGQDELMKSGGLHFFNVYQAKDIVEYIFTTFFQHYKLYEYFFAHEQKEYTAYKEYNVETYDSSTLKNYRQLEEGILTDIFSRINFEQEASSSTDLFQMYRDTDKAEEDEVAPVEEAPLRLTILDIKCFLDKVVGDKINKMLLEILQKIKDSEDSCLNKINKIFQKFQ